MAFKTLEQRFNEKVNQLYAGATLKFDNGKRSTGTFDEPFIVRRVGDGYFGAASRALGRFLPVASAVEDVKRVTLFTFNSRGLVFLAKQALLQTGNTFEKTRVLNPVFAVAAAATPGAGNIVRVRRHLLPLKTLLTKTDPYSGDLLDTWKKGMLQETTYDAVRGRYDATSKKPSFGAQLASPIKNLYNSAKNAKENVGEFGWDYSRPELGKKDEEYVVLGKYFDTRLTTSRFDISSQSYREGVPYTSYSAFSIIPPRITDMENESLLENKYKTTSISSFEDIPSDTTQRLTPERIKINKSISYAVKTQDNGNVLTPYIKYFRGGEGSIIGNRNITDAEGIRSQNARDLALDAEGERRKVSYIKDPGNVTSPTNANRLDAYRNLPTSFDDPIVVSFGMGNDTPVQFRAFIKDLDQSVSPEYKSSQYIGRIEKFVSYVSVQRTLSFKLAVLAFSKDELDVVWKRINFLTGLAYPYGYNRGILQPNIVRLTLGNLYINQPGYITNLSTNFNETTESWDIDRKVPIGASITMQFTLIEKRTVTANSPLYGITETIPGFTQQSAQAITNTTT